MISIIRKEDCCGCNACVQKCPKNCISIIKDEEGFWYPKINESECIHCNLCEKTCPIQNPQEEKKPHLVLAAKNPNENVRKHSSSGGVFTAIGEYVVQNGGVVFGAKFNDNWEVVHDYCENKDDLKHFRGSKYVQSRIGNQFIKAEKFLKEGKLVLFSGTPCHIAGLKRFLGKEYDNLITVDVVCHGVPSPLIWREYLKETISRIERASYDNFKCETVNTIANNNKKLIGKHIEHISFRDKQMGWRDYCFSITINESSNGYTKEYILYQKHLDNPFVMGFIRNLYLRQSCHSCKFRSGRSHSDLTLADFWGIKHVLPELNDDKGVNILLVNSPKGESLLGQLDINSYTSSYEQAVHWNKAIDKNFPINEIRSYFWKEYKIHGLKAIEKSLDKLKPSLIKKIKKRIYKFLKSK